MHVDNSTEVFVVPRRNDPLRAAQTGFDFDCRIAVFLPEVLRRGLRSLPGKNDHGLRLPPLEVAKKPVSGECIYGEPSCFRRQVNDLMSALRHDRTSEVIDK